MDNFLDKLCDVLEGLIPMSILFMVALPVLVCALRTKPEYHDIYEITEDGVVIEYDGELQLYDDDVAEGSEYVGGYYWVWEERCPENYHIEGAYKYWIRKEV